MDPAYSPPVVVAQWAPGASPLTVSPTWVDLPRVESLSISRGRQDELGTMDAGTATLVLGGHPVLDESLDPLDPGGATVVDGVPWTPVRVRATYAGTTYTMFTGYIDGDAFTPLGDGRGSSSPVQVSLVDWLGWAAQVELPSSAYEHIALELDPRVFLTGELSRGAAGPGLYDEGDLSWAPVIHQPVHAALLERSPIIPGSDTPAMDFTSYGAHTYAQQTIDMNPATAAGASVAFWIDTEPTLTKRYFVILRSDPSAGTALAAVGLDADGRPFAEIRNLSGAVLATAKTSGSIIADQAEGPVLITAWWSRTQKRVTVSVTDPALLGVWGGTDSGTATTGAAASSIAIGGGLLSVHDHASASPAKFSGLGVWSFGGSTELHEFVHLHDGAQLLHQIHSYLAAARVPFGAVDVNVPHPTRRVVGINGGGTLASELTAYGQAFAGATFMTRAGVLTVVALDDLDEHPWSTITHQVGDDPDEPWQMRTSTRGRTGRRLARVLNHAEVTHGPAWAESYPPQTRARSKSSIRRYGKRAFTPPWRIYDKADAEWIPQLIVDRYHRPRIELGEIAIDPLGDDRATKFVLGNASELLRTIRYVEVDRIDAPMRIQAQTIEWTNGRHWSAKYRIASDDPAVSYPDPAP